MTSGKNPKPALPHWPIIAVAVLVVAGVWYFTKPQAFTVVKAPEVAMAKKPLPTGPIVENQAAAFAGYAGDAACKACHAQEFGKWQGSNHGLAERPLNAAVDKDAFEPSKTFQHATQSTTAKWHGGAATLMALGFGGKTEPWKIDRVIGHDPLRQFLIAGEGGRLHTAEACWDPHKKDWFNVYGMEDRMPGEWGHWTGRGMVWNVMCAGCHNTRVRKNYDAATDSYKTAMAHPSVSCESCHGPMKSHATWQTEHPGQKPDPTANKLDRDQTIDSCAMCHARRTELTGDFKPGDKFYDHFQLAIVDHSNIFYPDGQIWDEDYEFGPFHASKMYHAGVRCVDCHDPHTAKRILPGNDLCMRCHTAGAYPKAPAIMPTAHSFHGVDSTGNQCVNCHMPQTVYMQRHSRHDHGFTIPDPLLTKDYGIPNACNKCHQDKDDDWSLAAVEKWYGPRMERKTRSRAITMAKARRGDADARGELLALLDSDETPYWKAAACLMLDRWLGQPNVNQALMDALKHEHPLVRTSAARSLDPLVENHPEVRTALQPLLEDELRSVRVAAAWSRRQTVDPASVAGQELLHMLEYNADQPSGQMQLAQYQMSRGALPKSVEHMRNAVKWDPGSPPFRHDLAVGLSMMGDTPSALAELREAIKRNPNEGEYHFKLALGLAETNDISGAIAAFREAVRVDPRHSRAWYNLGLALNGQGQVEAALAALVQGEQANPQDAGIPYAAATIYARLGRKAEAVAATQRALVANPGMREAMELRMALEQR